MVFYQVDKKNLTKLSTLGAIAIYKGSQLKSIKFKNGISVPVGYWVIVKADKMTFLSDKKMRESFHED